MDTGSLTTLGGANILLNTLGILAAAIFGLMKHLNYKTKKDQLTAVRTAFEKTVANLGATVEIERLSSAILLRRFFDEESEVGIRGAPYTRDVVRVIAAVLRTEKTGVLQKTLGDGLAYAQSLRGADLQRTNLQGVYLGPRHERLWGSVRSHVIDLADVDFFRADLSRASLRGAYAPGAVFFEARLCQTVFNGANLHKANFSNATLRGADFRNATLTKADFSGADLTDCRFAGATLTGANFSGARNAPSLPLGKEAAHSGMEHAASVFYSKPGSLGLVHQHTSDVVRAWIRESGLNIVELSREEYPSSGPLEEIARRMRGCAGIVVLGLEDLDVTQGIWRAHTDETRPFDGTRLTTPWAHVEAGMAAGLGIPILLVSGHEVTGGVFDPLLIDESIWRVGLGGSERPPAYDQWCSAVRQHWHAVSPANLPTRA